MSELNLETHENRKQYHPGEMIEGLVGWEMDEPPESAELHLFWHTSGKGDRDVGAADTVAYENPAAVDAQIFSLRAPDGPSSYDGKLISIHWSLELIVEPGHHVERLDLIISPTGEPLRPRAIEDGDSAGAAGPLDAIKGAFQ